MSNEPQLVEVIRSCSTYFKKGDICILEFTSERKDFILKSLDNDNEIDQDFGYAYLPHIKFLGKK